MKFARDLPEAEQLAYCQARLAELETWLAQEEAQPEWRQDLPALRRRRLELASLRRRRNELLTPRLL